MDEIEDAMDLFETLEDVVQGARRQSRCREATLALTLALGCQHCEVSKIAIFDLLWPEEGTMSAPVPHDLPEYIDNDPPPRRLAHRAAKVYRLVHSWGWHHGHPGQEGLAPGVSVTGYASQQEALEAALEHMRGCSW